MGNETADSQTIRSPDGVVAGLAARQHGVVSLAQLRAAGLGDGAIKWRVRRGRLHPVHRGVYAVGYARVVGRGRMWAAVLAYGGVLSHRSAAAVWDLVPWPTTVDVTLAAKRRSVPGVRAHRSRTLTLEAICHDPADGLPITGVARTLADLATTETPYRLERICHRAEHLRILDVPDPSPRKLRAALATLEHADPKLPRAGLEDRFLELVAEAGLPRPEVDARIGPYVVDFLWRDVRLVVETDDVATHHTRRAFAADRRRDVELGLAGYRVLRFTWADVTGRPEWVRYAVSSAASSRKTST